MLYIYIVNNDAVAREETIWEVHSSVIRKLEFERDADVTRDWGLKMLQGMIVLLKLGLRC